MNDDDHLFMSDEEEWLWRWLPEGLSDEAAYQLFTLLEALTCAIERKYLAQLLRYRCQIDPLSGQPFD